jgi:diaminopimelate decarboxylase
MRTTQPDGRLERHRHDHVVANRVHAASAVADVVGRSCVADRLLTSVSLLQVVPGDVIAFLDTGVYREASASNFNALTRPASVPVTGDRASLSRPPETIEDVLAREWVPEHLGLAPVELAGAP